MLALSVCVCADVCMCVCVRVKYKVLGPACYFGVNYDIHVSLHQCMCHCVNATGVCDM